MHCETWFTSCIYIKHCLMVYTLYRVAKASDSLPASRVLSSQITGYHGSEVDSKETVELIFPINVRMRYILMLHN